MNDNKVPLIDSFPKDDKLRVVWAYGAVYRNTGVTRVPEIKIMLIEILHDGALSKNYIFRKVSVAQLDIVRYMTIWKGNKRTNKIWKNFKNYNNNDYRSNKRFSLNTNTSESIQFRENKKDSDYTYFPPYKYKISGIKNKNDYWSFAKSTFTKIESNRGITVLIPSMELLTSTYVPYEQTIRYKLLQYGLDDILTEYIKDSKNIDGNYHLELYGNKLESNISFLAYAKFNMISRKRLSRLFASLETSDEYTERYPKVLPYHPTKLDVVGDGIWLDKNTFFMFRINQYSLPEDNKIESYEQELEFDTDESKKENKSYTRVPQNLDDYNIPITNENNPHAGNASQHIISEVGVLNPNNGSIKHKKQKLNIVTNAERNIDIENTENIENASSAESVQADDSKNTAKITINGQDKSHLSQSKVLKMVIEALEYMRNSAIDISNDGSSLHIVNILFVDEECRLHREQMATQFSRVLKKAKKEINSFAEKKKRMTGKNKYLEKRNYMLLKIILNNGKFTYLFEIDRKGKEGFCGMFFTINKELDSASLINILFQIIQLKGVVKNVILPELKTKTFKHTTNKAKNLNENIQNNLEKAIKNGLFC